MKDEWREARTTSWLHEALFFKSVLEAAGIEAVVPDEHALNAQPFLANVSGGVRLLVRSGDLEKAREILVSAAVPEPDESHATTLREIAGRARQRSSGTFVLLTGSDRKAVARAVSTLASESGAELERIDLGALVRKYLGETEKALSRILADAERTGTILLFDEADALFGGSSSAGSKAPHGTRVIDFLLKRKETFAGLIILVLAELPTFEESGSDQVDYVLVFDPKSVS